MSLGRRRPSGRLGGHPEGLAPFCLYLPAAAGNPAVMAPRFRPVALRPRLSAGLPIQLQRQYAQEGPTRQARRFPSEHWCRAYFAPRAFCKAAARAPRPGFDAGHSAGVAAELLELLVVNAPPGGDPSPHLGRHRARWHAGDFRRERGLVGATTLPAARARTRDSRSGSRPHQHRDTGAAEKLNGS